MYYRICARTGGEERRAFPCLPFYKGAKYRHHPAHGGPVHDRFARVVADNLLTTLRDLGSYCMWRRVRAQKELRVSAGGCLH